MIGWKRKAALVEDALSGPIPAGLKEFATGPFLDIERQNFVQRYRECQKADGTWPSRIGPFRVEWTNKDNTTVEMNGLRIRVDVLCPSRFWSSKAYPINTQTEIGAAAIRWLSAVLEKRTQVIKSEKELEQRQAAYALRKVFQK